jgi:predicted  nucleic acid-binding Zn-ribbon protein
VTQMPRAIVELFDRVAKSRHGIAVVPAREERCSECHVRLRPQVFVEIRRNDHIVQCDSCQRILYFIAPQRTETTSA